MLEMKNIKSAIAILSALTLNLVTLQSTTAQSAAKRYIVVFKENPVTDVDSVVQEHTRLYALPEVTHTYKRVLKGYAALLPDALVTMLKNDPRVDFISPDYPVKAVGQTLPEGVQRIGGNLSSGKSGSGQGSVNTPIAIIDSGIQVNHPDLNVVGGHNCVGKGTSYNDGYGHGTHVAGTAAAKDNTIGVVGVAPGAPLYAVRVLDNTGNGSWSNVICGVDWVTTNSASTGIKVANMSLGGVNSSDDGNCGNTNKDALHQAICKSVAAGITYVAAAGNNSQDFSNFTPAAYSEVLTVTAMADFNGKPGGGAASTCGSDTTDADDFAASFSNFATIGTSNVNHTIAAPGACIESTWLSGGYLSISGTSMASPHVAGTVAVCIASSKCAGKTPQQIISKLRSDAAAQPITYGFQGDPNSPIGTHYYGPLVYTGNY